jgi:hypothetical protein
MELRVKKKYFISADESVPSPINGDWSVYHMFTKEFVRIVVGKKVWKSNSFCLNIALQVAKHFVSW